MKKQKLEQAEALAEKGIQPVIGKTYQTMFGKAVAIHDFLPSPDELTMNSPEKVKVTIELYKTSVDYFKQEARRLDSSYQRMIRNLLNRYVLGQNSSV